VQEAKGDCEQDRPGGDSKTGNNIAESEAVTTGADDTDCNKETKDETKTEKEKEGKSGNTEEKNTDTAPNKTEKKKSSKGKDGQVKSDVKKKGKTEEAEKPAKTQRKPGPSSSSLAALSRPRTSGRSSRASAKNDIIAKFQQGAPETPIPRNFKIQRSATAGATGASIKQKILQWCISKTRKYEARPSSLLYIFSVSCVILTHSYPHFFLDVSGCKHRELSSSWCDGMAFCALIHRFFPDAFDFASLDPKEREKNFTLAFQTAETLADCCPLLDVSDMLLMGKHPDPCVSSPMSSPSATASLR
uniref:Calponin-homology (CH) domain-containing protein n=1 Tax=Neogobius melanostomus TaxID=47308 RepID=A0A8C6TKB0_9GOBI